MKVYRLFSALAVVALLAYATPHLMAQQVNPTANSVTEEQLFQALQQGQSVSGRISIPDASAAALIKPDNKGWAGLQSGALRTFAVVSFLGTLAALVVFYLVRGRVMIDGGPAGRTIIRFDAIERFGHWLVASSFLVLAITGLNLVTGRVLLEPLIGEAAFGTLTQYGKLAHNYVAWPFMLGLVIIFVMWVGNNIPAKVDLQWLMQGGGLFSDKHHPPAKKFNAGQKIIFWSVIVGGSVQAYTGVMMLYPALAGTAADWQFYAVVHTIVSAVMAAIILGHIYIGSVGMQGAFDAMGKGEVDVNWAKQHHSLWAEEIERKGRKQAPRRGARAMPAE
jgi:formate dehydrogenase subunit gamma